MLLCVYLAFIVFSELGTVVNGLGVNEKPVGSECQTKTGTNGVCLVFHKCESVLLDIRRGTFKYEDIVRCGFVGYTEVICCALPSVSRTMQSTTTATTTTQTTTLDTTTIPATTALPEMTTPATTTPATTTPATTTHATTTIPTRKKTSITTFNSISTSTTSLPSSKLEDTECHTKSGAKGICRTFRNCKWVLHSLRRRIFGYEDIFRCGFIGNEEVICCPVIRITEPGEKSTKACETYPHVSLAHTNRIVGGIGADLDDFPHMAAIGKRSDVDGNFEWFCGGSLISKRYVLTAAHCRQESPTVVRLHDVDLNSDSPSDITVKIKRFVSHPKYRRSRHYFDIALLELRGNFEFSDYLFPACLMTETNLPKILDKQSANVSACGFGAVDHGMENANVLMQIELNIIDQATCNTSYIQENLRKLPHKIVPSQLCAFDPKKDTCQGDSGGPLQMMIDEKYFLVGVTSFGISCGSPIPAVYTRVSHFIRWIESYVWPL